MKRAFFRKTAAALCVLTVVGMFAACGETAETAEATEPQQEETKTVLVTIDADGRQIVVEDTEGKTVNQLLEQAKVTLNEGDLLSADQQSLVTENLTIRVLRRVTVKVTVPKTKSNPKTTYTLVFTGGTVGDALKALGVTVGADQEINHKEDEALEDGMEIVIKTKEAPKTENTSSNNKPSSNKKPSSSGTSNKPSSGSGSGSSSGGKTVVSVKYYEDCDGSGHGVKVITYSDGTQKEVPY